MGWKLFAVFIRRKPNAHTDEKINPDKELFFSQASTQECCQPEETESQNDEVEEPVEDSAPDNEFPEDEAPVDSGSDQPQDSSQGAEKPSFKVMSFEDFLSAK